MTLAQFMEMARADRVVEYYKTLRELAEKGVAVHEPGAKIMTAAETQAYLGRLMAEAAAKEAETNAAKSR